MSTQSGDYRSFMKQLEDTLDLYFRQKAPALPPNVKEAIVRFGPWIALILIILSLPALLFVLGLGTLLAPFSFLGGITVGFTYTITMVFSIARLVLEVMALPGLFRRARSGWYLMYYAALLGVVQHVLTFSIVGLIIGSLISFYILFQIREYYS